MYRIFVQDVKLNCTRQLCRNRDGSLSWWEADGYVIEGRAFETKEEAEALLANAPSLPWGCNGPARIENWSF